MTMDISEYLSRQVRWSRRTFGEGTRTVGITKHIEKECDEIRHRPEDLSEWIDVMLLAMDGYWRAGGTPNTFEADLQRKQDTNFGRVWPATATPADQPIEHVGAETGNDTGHVFRISSSQTPADVVGGRVACEACGKTWREHGLHRIERL